MLKMPQIPSKVVNELPHPSSGYATPRSPSAPEIVICFERERERLVYSISFSRIDTIAFQLAQPELVFSQVEEAKKHPKPFAFCNPFLLSASDGLRVLTVHRWARRAQNVSRSGRCTHTICLSFYTFLFFFSGQRREEIEREKMGLVHHFLSIFPQIKQLPMLV